MIKYTHIERKKEKKRKKRIELDILEIGVISDPRTIVGYQGVNARMLSAGAVVTKGDNTVKQPFNDSWTTRVTLTRIGDSVASAKHIFCYFHWREISRWFRV